MKGDIDKLKKKLEAAQKIVDSGEMDYMVVQSNGGIRFGVLPSKNDNTVDANTHN